MERELWKSLYWLAKTLDKRRRTWRYAVSDILAAYFWAVVHDRPTSWAAVREHWPNELEPAMLPPQCTLSRRLRRPQTVELMVAVEQHLLALVVVSRYWVWSIDGKALPVSPVSKDPDVGLGYASRGWMKGYKFHAVWGAPPMPAAWGLSPMHTSEKTIARELICSLPGEGYLLADSSYDANLLYDLAAQAGYQLVVPKLPGRSRGGLGHRPHSPFRLRSIELLKKPFGRQLFRQRRIIECRFGTMTSFGGGLAPLPAWVRRFHRVRNWIHAKILIVGVRWLLHHAPEKLSTA
jgi:hypothetical protein